MASPRPVTPSLVGTPAADGTGTAYGNGATYTASPLDLTFMPNGYWTLVVAVELLLITTPLLVD